MCASRTWATRWAATAWTTASSGLTVSLHKPMIPCRCRYTQLSLFHPCAPDLWEPQSPTIMQQWRPCESCSCHRQASLAACPVPIFPSGPNRKLCQFSMHHRPTKWLLKWCAIARRRAREAVGAAERVEQRGRGRQLPQHRGAAARPIPARGGPAAVGAHLHRVHDAVRLQDGPPHRLPLRRHPPRRRLPVRPRAPALIP